MIAVIDTSALIRLFVPDGPLTQGLEEFFHGVERGRNSAIAPELLMVESANVLSKKRKSGELTGEESRHLLTDVLAMPIRLFPHRALIPRAFELAGEHNLTVYDALYLALAIEHGTGIFSGDKSICQVADMLGL